MFSNTDYFSFLNSSKRLITNVFSVLFETILITWNDNLYFTTNGSAINKHNKRQNRPKVRKKRNLSDTKYMISFFFIFLLCLFLF